MLDAAQRCLAPAVYRSGAGSGAYHNAVLTSGEPASRAELIPNSLDIGAVVLVAAFPEFDIEIYSRLDITRVWVKDLKVGDLELAKGQPSPEAVLDNDLAVHEITWIESTACDNLKKYAIDFVD